jgi:hypothetical protein
MCLFSRRLPLDKPWLLLQNFSGGPIYTFDQQQYPIGNPGFAEILSTGAVDANAQLPDCKDTLLHQLLKDTEAPPGLVMQLVASGTEVTVTNSSKG